MYVCIYVCMHACMHVCMYVCMHMHACMYVCMYLCVYLCAVEFKFIAWSSIAQSVCQLVFSLLAIWCPRPWWVRILLSAEEDNLSPLDSNIACLCQSIEINNNKHVCTQFQWREAYVLDNWQLAELPQSGGREFDPHRVHDNLSVPLFICVSLCQSIIIKPTNMYVCMYVS